MNISLIEPIGVSRAMIDALAAPIRAQGHTFTYYDTKTIDPQELIRRSMGCEVVMIANNPYPDAVVRAADRLKMLDVAFTGIDHVGLDACREKGVTVCNAANYSNQTVAELAVGMAIDLLRHVIPADIAVRQGGTSAGLTGREICGKTVGIVGLGRIGAITAKLFMAFGAKVIAHSRTEKDDMKALGIEYMPLDQLIASFEAFIPFIHSKRDIVLYNALPFNVLKGLAICLITMLSYKSLRPILKGRETT